MPQTSKTIDLAKLASEDSNLVHSMAQELEGSGDRNEQSAECDLRWPTRFISAGIKGAPPRWPTRFVTYQKTAPDRD